MVPSTQRCYGVGDCLIGSQYLYSSGGFRDDADEGAHPFDLQTAEDTLVFQGTCATGCATGSISVQVTPTAGAATQGDGRYLIDKNPANVLSTGLIVGGNTSGRQALANFSGTSFPVSVLLETAQTIPTQSNNIAPGTVTVPIVTSGVPSGFATSTAALTSGTGVACLSDISVGDGRSANFETAAYTVVDSSHIQLVLNRPHANNATIAVGGLCGYGLEQTADTTIGLRQVFPVIASPSSTSVLYAGGATPIVGAQGSTSSFLNLNLVVASIARTAGIVTVSTAGTLPVDVNGLTLTVQGVSDCSYNGSFLVTTTGSNTLTYASAGPDSTSSGGSLTYTNGAFALYPMAEVLQVYNAATHAVDGLMSLAANTVHWTTGDILEQPHYYQQRVLPDISYITQYSPRPLAAGTAGIYYQGNNGPGLQGWTINNATPFSSYFGNGGTHSVPSTGISVTGAWNHAIDLQAGETAAIDVHCNSHGCNDWNSTYDLFQMDTPVGQDHITYAPSTGGLSFLLRGQSYAFTPSALTAATINVGTLNATAVHGSLTGSFAGTITPASVPIFGASGAGHQPGGVPDPGPTSGTARFLREDSSWATPPGVGIPAAYSPTTSYPLYALVTSGGNVYQSQTAANTGNSITNTTFWQPIATAAGAVQSLFGATPPTLKQIPVGTSAGVYQPTNLTAAFIGAVTAPTLPVTPMADFQFTEGTGTTVVDQTASGNGNLTLQSASGRTPTWGAGGLTIANAQGVDLPATYNSAQTWCFALNLTPLGASTFNAQNNYAALLTSNSGITGSNITLGYAGSLVGNAIGYLSGAVAPATVSTSPRTTTNRVIAGLHRLCLVQGTAGTSVDHFYDNGVEVDSYGIQGAAAGFQTSSFLTLGAANVAPWNTANVGLFGSTVYRMLPFAGALTAAQIAQVDVAMTGNLISRGLTPNPALPKLSVPQLVFVGDSLTACYQVSPSSACWTSNLTLTNQPAYVQTKLAVTGLTALAISGAEPFRAGQFCHGLQGNAVVALWEGTNDLGSLSGESPQKVASNVFGAVDTLSAAGCSVYLGTIISRSGNAGDGTLFETERATTNALIRQGLKQHSAKGIIDLGANPIIGATGVYSNSTYFYSDGVHVLAAGQPYIEAAVNNSLNFYSGSTLSAPSFYTASATLPSSARVVDATGCTATCNFVLPDGVGPTGEEYTILTGSFTTTVQGQTLYGQTQTVNGSSAAVTLPANTKVTLRSVVLPQSTAGIKWVM